MIPVTTSPLLSHKIVCKLCRIYKVIRISFMKNENKYEHLNYVTLSPQFPVYMTEFLLKSFKHPVVNIITVTFLFFKQ